MRVARLPPVLLALAAALALGAPARAGARAPSPLIGIADQKPSMFSDPRFLGLPIRFARLDVGWDALDDPAQAARIDAWLTAAQTAGVKPLVTFDRSNTTGHRDLLPTTAAFLAQFRRWRERYPQVTEFSTWNEANLSHLTVRRPATVARWWTALSAACPTCRIIATDVLDLPNMARWVRRFLRAAGRQPRYWGMHNYVDVNRMQATGTRTMLGLVRGQVWLTETGGLVSRRFRSKVTFPESVAHQTVVMRWLFDRLVPLSRRIARVYAYHWDQAPGVRRPSWDSGLIGPDGRARPAYQVLRNRLRLYDARAGRL